MGRAVPLPLASAAAAAAAAAAAGIINELATATSAEAKEGRKRRGLYSLAAASLDAASGVCRVLGAK